MKKRLKIRTQLMILQVTIIITSMGLSSVSLLLYDINYFEGQYDRETSSILDTIAHNLRTPLEFLDFEEAERTLKALSYHDDYSFAYVKNTAGQIVARYHGSDAKYSSEIENYMRDNKTPQGLKIFKLDIKSEGEQNLGSLYLFSNLTSLKAHKKSYLTIFVIIFLLSLGLTSFLGLYAQYPITRALSGLADTATEISEKSDYSKRFSLNSDGRVSHEIHTLVDKFNGMIDLIQQRDGQIKEANSDLEEKVTQRTKELHEVQKKALVNARLAGISEITNSILHNVGNVMNSINISAQELKKNLKNMDHGRMDILAKMLEEHRDRLPKFFSEDPKGLQFPEVLRKLTDSFSRAYERLSREVSDLSKNSEHAVHIISMQQSISKYSNVLEEVKPQDLLTDSVSIYGRLEKRHGIKIDFDLEDVPPVLIDKHKVIQIIVNLISNAKHALDECKNEDKKIILRLRNHHNEKVVLEVADNGSGVAKENLEKIFQLGFTTKASGHGYGLHSSAIAATEMGGSLMCHSDGPGQGATFRLEVPFKTERKAA